MTASERAKREIVCPSCRYVNVVGDRFCGGCGHAVGEPSTEPLGRRRPPPPARPDLRVHERPRPHAGRRDAVTRYLCAAAHLSSGFSDAVIGEYLIEPTRAMPFLPGVNTSAVIHEAVAARYRRRVRDAVLLVLFVLIAILAFPLLFIWFVVAVGVVVLSVTARTWTRYASLINIAGAVLGAAFGLVAVAVSWDTIGYPFAFLLYSLGIPADLTIGAGLGLFAVLVVAAILVADEFAVTKVTREHFRAPNFVPDATALPDGWLRSFRLMGHGRYAHELARVSAAEQESFTRPGMAEVIVHRHRSPFVGAGPMIRDEVLALPLVPDEESGEPPVEFTPLELHDHISVALAALRDSASLSPGGRLADLSIHEQVFLPAEQLLRDSGTSLRPVILPDLRRAPRSQFNLHEARALANRPQEAARYYRCYRVESWDRDLMTSSYFTAGTDLRTLYVEWTHCVLWPVQPNYRSIDRHQAIGPGRRAFESIVKFPASTPLRFAGLLHRFGRIPYSPGETEPARYGAGYSIREHAAAASADSFFQDADAVRYIQVVEQAIFKAIGTFLEDRHYSIEDVLGAAKAKIVSSSISIANGTFVNSAIGIGQVQQGNVAGGAQPGQGGGNDRKRS